MNLPPKSTLARCSTCWEVHGARPYSSVVSSGNMLYGTASEGGSAGDGTIFSIFVPPQLTIRPAGASVILSWPTNATRFILQSTTNLVSPFWITNSSAPIVLKGQNTVTTPISGTSQFYRLSQ